MDIAFAKNNFDSYANWLKLHGACKFEVMRNTKGVILPEIKTGEVDMAGPLWPQLDDNIIYVGGYWENRIIGATDANISSDEMRTLHMGLDFFAPSETAIYAPLEGKIHSFKNNDGPRDYGPCIIIEHEFGELKFYTLYGHLNIDCLNNISIGQKIEAGAKIAQLGCKSENGGWPPHLHFQVILDMMEKYGDFDGLCRPIDTNFWQYICPSPYDFLGLKAQLLNRG